MKKNKLFIAVFLSLSISVPSLHAQSGMIVHDLSTGVVNGTSSLIPYGTNDDTWKVALPFRPGFFQSAKVCSDLNGAWGTNSCGRWITPKLAEDGIQPAYESYTGVFQYQTKFDLEHHCFPWARINLSYVGGDNNIVRCIVNGNVYTLSPATTDDYNPLTQNISINLNVSHLIVGTNQIIIEVSNSEAYTGFFACGNVMIGYCP